MADRWFFLAWMYCVLSVSAGVAFDAPQLSISNAAPEYIVTWPGGVASWVLEDSSNPTAASGWTVVPAERYESDNAGTRVRFQTGEAARFYRLRKVLPPIPDLTGFWTFDGTTAGVPSALGATSQLLQSSNTTTAAGRMGPHSLQFDGTGAAWITNAGYSVLPSSGNPFSVSFWFNVGTVAPGVRALAGNATTSTSGWRIAVNNVGPGTNDLVFNSIGMGCTLSVTGRTRLLPQRWHHLTATYGNGEGRLYLDGVLVGNGSGDVCMAETPIFLGGGLAGLENFIGRIDEFRTLKRCLSEEEAGLTGEWRFEDGEAGIGGDTSVSANHATPTNPQMITPGRAGTALDLSRGQLVIPNHDFRALPPSGGAFGISLWLRPTSLEREGALLSCGNGNGGWVLRIRGDGGDGSELELCSTNLGGTLKLAAPVALTNGAWTKVDLDYNGGIAALYADGQQIGRASGAIRGTSEPLVVGTMEGLDAAIDDLKIYCHERAPSAIGPIAEMQSETVFLRGTTNIYLPGSGPRGRQLTYEIVSGWTPTNGTIVHAPGSPVVTYHAGARKGPDSFAYRVSDGEFTSAPAIVNLSVVEPHWLSPEGSPDGNGSGPDQPWAAATAAALDSIWRTNNYYDCFFYAPGTYLTTGFRVEQRTTANPGCKHIGAGPAGAPEGTTLRLTESLNAWVEGIVFAAPHGTICNDFEVRDMLIDCNAANLPMYSRGEPIRLRIPLASPSIVESITVHWADRTIPGRGWRLAGGVEFTVSALRSGSNTLTRLVTSTGLVDVVSLDAQADELLIQLTRRDAAADFYGIAEIEIAGAAASLPKAHGPGGGANRLAPEYPVCAALDGNAGTAWVSDSNAPVTLTIPLEAGSAITGMELQWNCQTIKGFGRAGAAGDYTIRARNPETGGHVDIPFVREHRAAEGREHVSFGTNASPDRIITDELILVLNDRELGVDFFSLKEIALQNGLVPVPVRLPSAESSLAYDQAYSFHRAFDGVPATEWASRPLSAISAIFVAGNNLRFTHLKVIGFGTKAGAECFPMNLSPQTTSRPVHVGNVLVEDCVFTDPAPVNKDVVSVIVAVAASPNTLTNAVVRRCTVNGMKSYFPLSHGVGAPTVEGCLVTDCDVGSYWESVQSSSDYGYVTIRSNRFINVARGIYFSMGAGMQFDTMECINNEMILTGGGYGIGACDICAVGPSGSIRGLTALGNVIRYPDWQRRAGSIDVGIYYSDIQHAVIANNTIAIRNGSDLQVRLCPGGIIYPPPEPDNCDVRPVNGPGQPTTPPCVDELLPGYRRAWYNNRDISGTLLDVHIRKYGFETLAVQQQWGE